MNSNYDETVKKSEWDGFEKSLNSRCENFVIMRRTYRTLNDYEMQNNAEVGLFTKPSIISIEVTTVRLKFLIDDVTHRYYLIMAPFSLLSIWNSKTWGSYSFAQKFENAKGDSIWVKVFTQFYRFWVLRFSRKCPFYKCFSGSITQSICLALVTN